MDTLKWQSILGFEAIGLRHSKEKGRFDVYLANSELHTFMVLAERADNPGASITNGYERYAAAVCEVQGINPKECLFFELYADPGRRKGGIRFSGADGVEGTATIDRVLVDMTEDNTHWLPGKRLGETVWRSLRECVDVAWSYPVPRRIAERLTTGSPRS